MLKNEMQIFGHIFRASFVLQNRQKWLNFGQHFRTYGKITIDGITKQLIEPKNPLFVPQNYGNYYEKKLK